MKALIVDDEHGVRLALAHFLKGRGYEVFEAATGAEGLNLARKSNPDIVFLDQRLPDMSGEALLNPLHSADIDASVIMMTAFVELDQAIQAMRKGAEYFFAKPIDLAQVEMLLENLEQNYRLKQQVRHYHSLNDACEEESLVGQSPPMQRVQRLIMLLGENRTTPVLILGESGTGKELAAKSIHRLSGFSGSLVEINCASLPETLLESELFGHEKGAFTDARETKRGLFEIAAGGSIFFDEIGEMPLSVQAKLLKVLDSGSFRRIGGTTELKSDARIMAATNRDLAALVQQGKFREDLWYRINILPLTLPPLRERGEDVALLAAYLGRILCRRMGRRYCGISADVLGSLSRYRWPGNVRELKNVIERALILARGEELGVEHLPSEVGGYKQPAPAIGDEPFKTLQELEDQYIQQVLAATGNNHSRTANILDISRSTLLVKLKKKG